MKKIIALLLVAVMVLGLLAGCGKSEVPAENAPAGNAPAAAAPAEGEKLKEVTLTWYLGQEPQADTEMVEQAVNEYLKDTLNVKLDIIEVPFGEMDEKVRVALAGGEPFDLCFTSNWSNDFLTNVAKDAYLPLDDLLQEYGQGILEVLPEGCWGAPTVNGKIYGIPNQQIWTYQGFIGVKTEWLEKYNFDLSTVKKLEDIEPLMDQIKADYPDMYPVSNSQYIGPYDNLILGFENPAGDNSPLYVSFDDETCTVKSIYDSEEFVEMQRLMYKWAQKGYFRPDAGSMPNNDADRINGTAIYEYNSAYAPGVDVYLSNRFDGSAFTCQPLMEGIMCTNSITATLTAISRTSENPERAMMFLNQLFTDPVLFNLIAMGIEGVHYNMDGKYAVPVENCGYNPNSDWAIGNTFLAHLRVGQSETVFEETAEINNTANVSPLMGFNFDATPVQNELAAMASVVDEYKYTLRSGAVDPDTILPEIRAKLETAGLNIAKEEMQRQINEWKAANGK